jgi:glycine/serine hydroxymethyltransferase
MKEAEMIKIAKWINEVIEIILPYSKLESVDFQKKVANLKRIREVKKEVKKLCLKFPLPD